MAMEPELKKKWIDALRSGDYEQTTRCLHDGEGFCCLGVLADVADLWDDIGKYSVNYNSEGLGVSTCKKLGIKYTTHLAGNMNEPGDTILMEMNDSGKSFDEIADYIEEHL